mmetsp:Transcript_17748/g.42901  ORF Transcript_17748/g.42901 Transcript_17748/m.42901 type:complete len:252 (-) Transcript_17748:157-912(-)
MDKVPHVAPLPLGVVDHVAEVQVLVLENVEDRKQHSIVRHQPLANPKVRIDHRLEDLESDADDFRVVGNERVSDMFDDLGEIGEDAERACGCQVQDPAPCEKLVRFLLLEQPLKQDGEVEIVVQRIGVLGPQEVVVQAAGPHGRGEVAAVKQAPQQRHASPVVLSCVGWPHLRRIVLQGRRKRPGDGAAEDARGAADSGEEGGRLRRPTTSSLPPIKKIHRFVADRPERGEAARPAWAVAAPGGPVYGNCR